VATKEIQEERVRQLNQKEIIEGDHVLYWMQEAQRAEYNHALEYAGQRANELSQPLLVIFGLMDMATRGRTSDTTPSCSKGCRT
jgi:deoxyribodipyrimidine photo-lyase